MGKNRIRDKKIGVGERANGKVTNGYTSSSPSHPLLFFFFFFFFRLLGGLSGHKNG